MTRRGILVLVVGALFASAPFPAFAQTVATIVGIVTDSTGGALPGVTVQVVNEQTGISRSVVTDPEGRYRAPNLALGEYRLEGTLMGFQTAVRRGIVLTIGREATVDLELRIGEISETIEVSADAPLVDTASAGITALVTREQMADLPLNARDFSQLINLQAGTVNVGQADTVAGATGNAGQSAGARISISGARPTSNVFVLDGTEIQTAYGTLPSGVGGATLGLEAVQEFKVLTNSYSAQYGRSVGGTVVAASRAGTNEYHGSGYWYMRNDAFDAKNFFDVGEKPDFSRNQFGGGFGGPIVKNRTFFFGNYEKLRERLPRQLSAIVPSAAAREGRLPTQTVTVSPVIKPYLDLYPMPNGRDFGDGTAEYTTSGNRPIDQVYTSIRVDHQLRQNSQIFARYTRDVSDLENPAAIPLYNTTALSKNHYLTVEQNQVLSPTMVNQARFSFTRTVVGTAPLAVTEINPSLSFFQGRPFGTLDIVGLNSLPGDGGDNTDTVDALILADDATWDAGSHSIHFGGALSLIRFERISFGERFSGQFEFGSLTDFLTNAPAQRLRISGFNADPEREFKNKLINFYLQDDIRLHSRLVLNIGTRFDYLTNPSEREGRLANLRDIRDTQTTVGDPFYENPGGFFSPRIGLVWDPTGDATTSVRTGFGLFHEPLMMKSYVVAMTREPPFWTEVDPSRTQLVGLFPDVTSQLERLTREAPQAIHVFEYKPHNLYSMQWNLSVQRQLAANFVAEVGYVGTRGMHLLGRKEWAVPERTDVNGETFYAPSAQYINPSFTRLNYYDTSGKSQYHALKTTVSKRFSDGLHFQGSYTFSKSMDTESATILGELGATSVSDPYDAMRDWAPSDFNVPHVFSGSASYRLPFGQGGTGIGAALARGWQVSGIIAAQSGRPFSVTSNSQLTHALLRTSTRPDLIEGGDSNPILGNYQQWFDPTQFVPQRAGFYGNVGRNTLIGPGLFKLDMSVVRDMSLGGGRVLQVRAEIFNLTNRVNLGQPDGLLFNNRGQRLASAGIIRNTVTSARQGQIAIRMTF